MTSSSKKIDYLSLARKIKQWGKELGFQQVGISDTELSEHEAHLFNWLHQNNHGDMDYMARHGTKRCRPAELVLGTIRILSLRMDYLPPNGCDPEEILQSPTQAYISRYALGRDYHKVLRKRLQHLAKRIERVTGPFGYRAFVDTAPVLEKAIAAKSGLGWIGKHTNLINRKAGSWFFLGELYTDLPLPTDLPEENHCGRCQACIDICPTKAITAPYRLDARRCISYLTIELKGSIPVELRPLMGNRIYGCDDCQLVCPWNRFAKTSDLPDFNIRHGLDTASLIQLFQWTSQEFLERTEGSPIRRLGYDRWLRNIAVALGNAPPTESILRSLKARLTHPSEMVREHIRWAIHQQQK